MDNGTSARQFHSSKSDVLSDMLQVMQFSLTFTAPQGCLFWRLLNVGCMLADELLDLLANPEKTTTPDSALLWNALSTEFAALLKNDAVRVLNLRGGLA